MKEVFTNMGGVSEVSQGEVRQEVQNVPRIDDMMETVK